MEIIFVMIWNQDGLLETTKHVTDECFFNQIKKAKMREMKNHLYFFNYENGVHEQRKLCELEIRVGSYDRISIKDV